MTTIINNPKGGGNDNEPGSGTGVILGVVIALVLLIILFMYGLPYLRGSTRQQDANPSIKLEVPVPGQNNQNNNPGGTNPGGNTGGSGTSGGGTGY